MRITKVNIPKSDDDGLDNIKMNKLEQVVLLTGKNGSGKTRIINKIVDNLKIKLRRNQNEIDIKDINDKKIEVHQITEKIKNYEEELNTLRINNSLTEEREKEISKEIEKIRYSLIRKKGNLDLLIKKYRGDFIEVEGLTENAKVIDFIPKELNLQDCNDLPQNILKENAEKTKILGVEELSQGTLAQIQYLQNKWFIATHKNSQISKYEKDKTIKEYNNLKKLINTFLGSKINRDTEGNATIFGYPLGQAKLSEGQNILLQLCLALFYQGDQLKDLVLILDEPENHLHPSAIIQTIEEIKGYIPNGQIWIATHSIPLLTHFNLSLIWYVDNGKISWVGKEPEKVLGGLLGNENDISQLQDFLGLPAQLASVKFAFDCLLEPETKYTGIDDEQTCQIRKELLEISKDRKIRILDFGAGKGRLISYIAELDKEENTKLIDKLDYIAYDISNKDKDSCENIIYNIYNQNEKKRYFNDKNELYSNFRNNSFDIVIMCNVFHEIEAKDWLDLFKEDGTIPSLLDKGGILLIVEDHQLPMGEKAYQKGFLVLDTPQIRCLFDINKDDDKWFESSPFPKYKNRLKAHRIKRDWLIKITGETKEKALNSLCKLAKDKILEKRKEEANYTNGKIHAFWVQQFANAQLSLSEFVK
jgi:SAM-dependent methyltransferase/predicted ATPase